MNTVLSLSRFWWRKRPAPQDASLHFDQLRASHLEAVFSYTRRRLPTRDDAEDATAEAFAAAFVHLHRCPPLPEAQRAWLLGIAKKKVADLLRKRYRHQTALLSSEPTDPAPTPEAAALRAEESAELRRQVMKLPPDQREALLLKYADGLSVAEVGAVLGKSDAAVSSLLQRARATLIARKEKTP